MVFFWAPHWSQLWRTRQDMVREFAKLAVKGLSCQCGCQGNCHFWRSPSNLVKCWCKMHLNNDSGSMDRRKLAARSDTVDGRNLAADDMEPIRLLHTCFIIHLNWLAGFLNLHRSHQKPFVSPCQFVIPKWRSIAIRVIFLKYRLSQHKVLISTFRKNLKTSFWASNIWNLHLCSGLIRPNFSTLPVFPSLCCWNYLTSTLFACIRYWWTRRISFCNDCCGLQICSSMFWSHINSLETWSLDLLVILDPSALWGVFLRWLTLGGAPRNCIYSFDKDRIWSQMGRFERFFEICSSNILLGGIEWMWYS